MHQGQVGARAPLTLLDHPPRMPRVTQIPVPRSSRRAAAFLAVAAVLVFLSSVGSAPARSASAQAAPELAAPGLREVAQLGGASRAIGLDGDEALVGIGTRVVTFAVCHPGHPVEVGRSAPLPGLVRDVLVQHGYAYAAIGEAGLAVLDVRKPERPVVLGVVPLDGVAARLVTSQGRLYVVAGYGGLHILDLGDPASPHLLGTFAKIVTDVAVRHPTAYVVARDLMIVDVSDPSAPTQVSVLDKWTDAIASDERHIYVAVSTSIGGGQRRAEVKIYDVSDPNPLKARLISRIDIAAQARMSHLADRRLYVYARDAMHLIDVSVPSRPARLLSFTTYATVSDFAVRGDVIYLAAGGAGFRILEVTGGGKAFEIASVPTIGKASALAVNDGTVYVEDEGPGGGVVVIGLSDPRRPHVLTRIDAEVAHRAMLARGGRLLIGTPDHVLRLYDVTDPLHPSIVSELLLPEAILDLDAARDFVYVANDRHLRVVDIRNPDRPFEIGSMRATGGAAAIAVSQGFAYVTGPTTGTETRRPSLQVIDVRDPFAPLEVGVMPDAIGWKSGVAASGLTAYVGALQVVDVSNPGRPVQVGRVVTDGKTKSIALSGQTVYASNDLQEEGGVVHAFDVTDPAAPTLRSSLATADAALDVDAWLGYVLVAGGEAGLVVLRDDSSAIDVPTPEPPPSLEWPQRVLMPLTAASAVIGRPCP